MFTDRFIKVPITVFDTKLKELTGAEVVADSYMKFNPMDLAAYRPSYDGGEPDRECVSITLKCGDSTLVYLSIEEFEKLLNNAI